MKCIPCPAICDEALSVLSVSVHILTTTSIIMILFLSVVSPYLPRRVQIIKSMLVNSFHLPIKNIKIFYKLKKDSDSLARFAFWLTQLDLFLLMMLSADNLIRLELTQVKV